MRDFTRSYPLEDISVRSGGDGRTVEAYAALFNTPADVNDMQGVYREQIARGAFDATIAARGTNFGVLYNHGLTLFGTPSDRGSMPIGTPLEVRADTRGLFTVTRYNNTPLADETLEAIKSGAIRAQSFRGRWIKTDQAVPRGGFRANADGTLPLVTRQEIALKEYGPSPFAVYEEAAITGVRASLTFSPDEQDVLKGLLANLAAGDDIVDQVVAQAVALLGLDSALDCAESYLSSLLNVPNPDDDALLSMVDDGMERSAALRRLEAVSARMRSSNATGDAGERSTAASNRQPHSHLNLRAKAREKGVL